MYVGFQITYFFVLIKLCFYRYLKKFTKFSYIIDGTLESEVDEFLNVEEELDVQKFPEV